MDTVGTLLLVVLVFNTVTRSRVYRRAPKSRR
jgi:hypothetical protein